MSTFLNVLPGSVCPTICLEIDVTNDPTSGTVTWTDFTPRLVSYSRAPVRQNEFDQPQGASGAVVLRNDDGALIPDNTAGPYYGQLKKLRRCRVRAQWAGVTYNRFWGYVQDWPQAWDSYGRDQKVSLTLTDGMVPLATYDLGGQDFASKMSGSALADVLASAGITATDLDGGKSTIVDSGTLTSPTYALQRCQDIAASENGVVFADGGGTILFHDRSHRVSSSMASGTIGDASGEVPYNAPTPQYGDAWPIVKVTPVGGSVVTSINAAGTASYYQRTLTFPTAGQYLVSDPTEAQEAAGYLANRYANPLTRIPAVSLDGARDPTQWPLILGLDTSTKVLFRRRFRNGPTVGGTVELNQFVEGYGDNVQVGQAWGVTVALSPADLQDYWVLGDATLGLLGVTTRLFY